MFNIGSVKKILLVGMAALTLLSYGTAEAKKAPKPVEYPLGVMQEAKQLPYTVTLTYMKPCAVEPEGVTLPAKQADFHLKAVVAAKAENAANDKTGERIPGLHVSYKMLKQETGLLVEGELLPLEDEKGIYYGTNIKLFDIGTYKCVFTFTGEPREGEELSTEQLTWIFKFIPRKKW